MNEWKQKKNFLTSFTYALRGLKEGYVREIHVRKQAWIFAGVILLALFLRVSLIEFALVVLASGFVLGLEMLNTALEEIEDVMWPEYREAIRRSKDIAAGAVLIAGVTAIVIGGIVFLPHLAKLVY